MKQQNLWHTMSVAEVEKRFKTDCKSGLTPKIAQTRLQRFGRNELFIPEPRSVKRCMMRILSDVSFWVLAFVALIALFFGRFATALTVLFVLAISCTASTVAYVKTNRIKEAMSSYSAPRVRIMRGGRELLCDAASVVPGDVLLLRVGDVVPCDARLIDSNAAFCVLNYQCDAEGKVSYLPCLKDAGALYDTSDDTDVLKRANMVHAGSVVHKGEARAIVTETGESTYIAACFGPHPLATQVGEPAYLKPMRKYMNRYSLIMCALILPVTIVGIFMGKGSLDILDVLLLILSLVVSSMSEQLLSMGRIVCACAVIRASYGTNHNNTAIIKNYQAIDALGRVDELFLFGKTALSDGHMHPYAAYTAEGLSIGHKMKNRAVAQLYETVYRYERCIAENNISDEDDYINATEWSNAVGELGDLLSFDRASADIRTLSLRPMPAAPEWVEVAMRRPGDQPERRFRIHRCTQPEPLLRCNASNKGGKTIALDNAARQMLFDVFCHLKNQGTDVCAYVREERGYVIFEGILSCREAFDPELRETRRRLEESHVRVSLFLPEEGASYMNYLMSAGWIESEKEAVNASAIRRHGKTLADVFGKKRVFLGFSEQEIAEQITLCRESGKLTASLGLRHGEVQMMNPADICISCEPRDYSTNIQNEQHIEPVSALTAEECDQSVRRNSDVLIRRAGPDGGGLSGIANAIYTARSISFRMMLTMQYLLVAQLLRMTLVIVPLMFGWLTISPALLLISGVWVDLAYILVCALHHCSLDVLREAPDYDRFFKAPLRSRPDWVCATVVSGLFVVLTGWILKGTGAAMQTGGLSLYMFLCLFVIQSCLLFCLLRTAGSFAGHWKSHAASLLVVGILLGILVIVLFVSPVAAWFGADGLSAIIAVFAAISPLYLLGSYFISLSYRKKFLVGMHRIFRNFKKSGKNPPPRE